MRKNIFKEVIIKDMYNKSNNKANNNEPASKQNAVPNRAHTEMKKAQSKVNNKADYTLDNCRSKADNKSGSNKAE